MSRIRASASRSQYFTIQSMAKKEEKPCSTYMFSINQTLLVTYRMSLDTRQRILKLFCKAWQGVQLMHSGLSPPSPQSPTPAPPTLVLASPLAHLWDLDFNCAFVPAHCRSVFIFQDLPVLRHFLKCKLIKEKFSNTLFLISLEIYSPLFASWPLFAKASMAPSGAMCSLQIEPSPVYRIDRKESS